MSLIEDFRTIMLENKIDFYIVPTSDYHNSEYISPYFKCRQYLSNFTGSAGTLLITKTTAYLWVDGRYFLQADNQVDSKEINVIKMGTPNSMTIFELLKSKLEKNDCIGFDGKLFSCSFVNELKKQFDFELNLNTKIDLFDGFWIDRPKLPFSSIYQLDMIYCGEEYKDKLAKVLAKMNEYNCDMHIISSLTDQAWLYNLRGNDIERTPVFLAYTVIDNKDTRLFVDTKKINPDVKEYLKANKIIVKTYNDFYKYISGISNKHILIDSKKINYEIYNSIKFNNNIVDKENPTILLKAIKNKTEIENIIEAQVKDASSIIKFIYQVKTAKDAEYTELTLCKLLESLREKHEGFVDLSFDTICAFNEHGAIVHYEATEQTNIPVTGNGLLLVDTGGHYLEGTTDITRTIGIGKITDEMKVAYTTVLKAHIALATAVFLKGTPANVLDMLPRQQLWKSKLDYRHGTGHGVGYLLSVHEEPNRFSYKYPSIPIEPGMITTNEPGVYVENKFGVRLENELLCINDISNEYGDFLKFQTISYVPFDQDCIKPSLLTKPEKDWINDYHETLYKKVSRSLTKPERDWLKLICKPL
ncbi:MAG: aminopeptidase P family protein [Acholeplasmatales bacterium]|nr:aminopeptidase P family protein [Acholeplasmatales bacterium]